MGRQRLKDTSICQPRLAVGRHVKKSREMEGVEDFHVPLLLVGAGLVDFSKLCGL